MIQLTQDKRIERGMELLKFAIFSIIINARLSRGQQISCPGNALFSYVTNPEDPCQVYLCYAGRLLFTPFQCRPNFPLDACSGCVYPITLRTPSTTSPVQSSTQLFSTIDLVITPTSYEGTHVIGGHRAASGVNEVECLLLCQYSVLCRAVDYNRAEKACWIHESDTACSPLVAKQDCVHYKLTSCNTSSTTETTMTPTPSTTTTTTTTTTSSVVVPNGFVFVAVGMHAQGGTRTLISVTEQQCLDFCLMESFCLAVDYNVLDHSCYIHFRDTYCNELTEETTTNHYTRLPCVGGNVTNMAFEVRNKFHVFGGDRRTDAVTLEQCLATCFTELSCAGIDFDASRNACYTFIPENTCDPLIPKDFCTHVTLQQCTFLQKQLKSLVTPTPTTTTTVTNSNLTSPYVPPNGDFIVINYPGPLTLPSKWQAYPGMRIDNGVPVGGMEMTGDECLALCLKDPQCEAVDFNSGDGTCYKHDKTRKCDVLLAANAVYHLKKPGLCSVITGTATPYPTPLGVAP